jgi:hypothetical protein
VIVAVNYSGKFFREDSHSIVGQSQNHRVPQLRHDFWYQIPAASNHAVLIKRSLKRKASIPELISRWLASDDEARWLAFAQSVTE